MKRNRIISLIVILCILSATICAYAESYDENSNFHSIQREELVYGKMYGGSYIVDSNSLNVSIPKNAKEEIAVKVKDDSGISPIRFMIPDSVFTSGHVNKYGGVEYCSKDESALLTVGVLKDEKQVCDALQVSLTIRNEKAPNSYEFKMPENYKIVEANRYAKEIVTDEENKDSFKSDPNELLYFVLDENNEIVNTIEASSAVDSNGNKVYTKYEIKGSTLIQNVNFEKGADYPITINTTSHPPITKYNILTLKKNDNGAKQAKKARREINDRQNNWFSTFLNVMTTVVSFIPISSIAVSYINSTVTAVSGGVSANLERQEDNYTLIYETFTGTSSTDKKVTKAVIKIPMWGRYQGKNKGYVYTQRKESLTFYDKNGNVVNIG